jgi:allantoate deiminase
MSAAAERIIARCRELARISDVEGETTRTYLSPAMRVANDLVASWMREAGLAASMDAAGNLRGVSAEGKPRIVLASHLDTVVNAGAFDGPLGVILGIEAAEQCKDDGLPVAIEVIGFAEEEGVRFSKPFLGSRAVVGALDQEVLALRDADGLSVLDVIKAYGLLPELLEEAKLRPEVIAYLEVHLEQGPVLEAEGRALAAVGVIAGQSRLRVRFEGQANHAGTTPMHLRKDALVSAAEWIVLVEAAAIEVEGLIATVGAITVEPNLGNVVPGIVTASVDVRHGDDATRTIAVEDLLQAAQETSERHGVAVSHTVLLEQRAVMLSAKLTMLLEESARAAGYEAPSMASGAGHDAMIVAPHVPAGMLFVRTPGGISHHPDENVSEEDVEAALRTTVEFLHRLKPEEASHA